MKNCTDESHKITYMGIEIPQMLYERFPWRTWQEKEFYCGLCNEVEDKQV